MGKSKHKKLMTHGYHIRIDDETWDCLQALRKGNPDFNVSEYIRKMIKQLYCQEVFYKSKKWNLLTLDEFQKGEKDGSKKKRTGKTSDEKKAK